MSVKSSKGGGSIDNYFLTQITKFEKTENKLIKSLINFEECLIKQNTKLYDLEELVEKSQNENKKLKVEFDVLKSKVSLSIIFYS